MGLATVGLVTLPSLVQAEEKASSVMTALSSTTLSGYVDTSAQWDLGTGNANPPPFAFNAGKQDGFNVNVVKVSLDKPLDEGQWAAGYHIDLAFGPDAVVVEGSGATSTYPIKQAYVVVRAPVGNGLDFKIGRWDTIIGYESFDSASNPNYTRSYGYTMEPTEHTGLLASYQCNKLISFSAGIANTATTLGINDKSPRSESAKTYLASVALTAPDDWGAVAGSSLYVGVIDGFGSATEDQSNFYIGATVNTPVKGLKVGASYDYVEHPGVANPAAPPPIVTGPTGRAYGAYASFQATEKLSVHGRLEYAEGYPAANPLVARDIFAWTGTLQYDLWKNVLSRLELRWDHATDGSPAFGGVATGSAPTKKNNVMAVANFVYKF
jgi:hypothetical protein